MGEYILQRYFDEIDLGELQVSRGRTITEADIVAWCSLTGDWFVIHSDKVYAERSSFGQRLAPGWMILAYSGGLGVPPDSETIIANYGTDKVRFVAPTYIGDTLHLEAAVLSKEERDARSGIVDFQWDMVNQNGRKVMTCVLRVLMARRPH